ncbi:TRAP transporter small permease [Pusillimonas sp. ANT_WB101]|uniref:TRAP transporter small permease n=1 Tax=Pusillimonas sp. ANT_WB101 TaxID=2597356 RepID=UPI0011ED31C8|nr:TRAP transporter small permease [Pusillimonas sp. ANT_WB101]KAA0892875.1 TRAP transporter small permease [Pusillimonas sp. ANT_WB101]
MTKTHNPSPAGAVLVLEQACCWFERIAIAMLLFTTFLVVLQVFARNVLQIGLPWADELARYGGLGIVYLAIPLLLLRGGHISVDLISSRVQGRLGRGLKLFNELMILGFCGFFLAGGYQFLLKAGKFVTPALRMPNLVFYLPAMLGIALFTLVAILRFWRVLSNQDPVAGAAKGPTP